MFELKNNFFNFQVEILKIPAAFPPNIASISSLVKQIPATGFLGRSFINFEVNSRPICRYLRK